MVPDLSLTLYEIPETEDGIVRLDPNDMHALGIAVGDVIAMEGARKTYARVLPAFMEDRNQRLARVSPLTAKNLGFLSGNVVRLLPDRLKPPRAERIVLETEDDLDRLHVLAREKQLTHFWRDRVVIADDRLRVPTLDRHPLIVKVSSSQPAGPITIGSGTEFAIAARKTETALPKIGGLREPYRTCQLLAEGHFKKRVSSAAQTVLLTGPAGCGKASLVDRLAKDIGVALRVFDAHNLIDQYLAQGSSELIVSLSDIARRGETILLFDHLEALSLPDRAPSALASAARAVMAQICVLLDEVPTQPSVMAFGVTSAPLEPRFVAQKRFDLHLPVDAPNRWGRHEILSLAASNISLADGVDMDALATMTPGATGRDLRGLVRTAHLMAAGPHVTERDLYQAFRSMTFSAVSEVRCDVPVTAWDEVAGFDEIKKMLCDTLSWSLQHYDRFAAVGVRPPSSVLLSGGEGMGKTTLVRALASYMPVNFVEVDCALLAGRTQAQAASFLQDSFALARRKAPCLVFFDEIDVLFESDEEDAEAAPHHHPIVSQLMADLDSMASFPGVVVIAASSRPDRLTAEILRPGRFDFAIALPLPDVGSRKKILQIHARKLPLAADIDFEKLAATTHGMSPADIANLCNRVGMMALRNSLIGPEGGIIPPVVNFALFEQALRGRKSPA